MDLDEYRLFAPAVVAINVSVELDYRYGWLIRVVGRREGDTWSQREQATLQTRFTKPAAEFVNEQVRWLLLGEQLS